MKGAGFRLAEDGGAETPIKLSDDLYSSELSDFINKLSELCKNDSIFNDPTYNGDASEAFFDGRAAFWINVVGNAAYLNESDVDYGILPMPLLNSDQDGYVTPLANNYSNYAIARSCDDDESAVAVLSALAYYGQTLVTPAVYELYFENSSADNGDTATIFWLMTETMRSDVDATFAREIRTVGDELSIAIRDGRSLEDEFGTLDRNAVERDLGILNEKLKGLNS